MQGQREDVLNVAHSLVEDFLNHLGERDYGYLKDKYGVSDAMASEIASYMADYFGGRDFQLSPPPRQIAFTHRKSRVPFAVHGEKDEARCWRIECLLWEGGEEEEITSVFDLFREDGRYRIQYLYTGS